MHLTLAVASTLAAISGPGTSAPDSSAATNPAANTKMLFIGNSHTEANNLTESIRFMLERSNALGTVAVEKLFCGSLQDLDKNQDVAQKIRDGKWKFVILQAQQISMSHKYSYSTDVAVRLGKLATESGARVLYFAEWPREGIRETDYIYNIYKGIAKQVGAEVVPVGHAFDNATSKNPYLKLWAPDGNHSSPLGAQLAARTFYFWIIGESATPPTSPAGARLDEKTRTLFDESALSACKEHR